VCSLHRSQQFGLWDQQWCFYFACCPLFFSPIAFSWLFCVYLVIYYYYYSEWQPCKMRTSCEIRTPVTSSGPKLLFSIQIGPWNEDTSELGTLLACPHGVFISQGSLHKKDIGSLNLHKFYVKLKLILFKTFFILNLFYVGVCNTEKGSWCPWPSPWRGLVAWVGPVLPPTSAWSMKTWRTAWGRQAALIFLPINANTIKHAQ
jgi:hypothetical protein